ncbi:MAG: type IV secretion system protein, partial [Silvibacterium sp.]|nr:type IV secretion system protein [Silvibacterium sp.]
MTTLLGLPVLTFGQLTPPAPPVISDPSTLTAAYESLVGQWLAVVSPYAFEVFMALAGLDLALFGWTLWRTYHGDIHSALLSTANKLLIIGFFLALLMNGETWMADIINMFIDLGKAASGMPSLSPSVVLLAGFKIFGSMLWQAMKSGLLTDLPTAAALVLAAFVICACFLLITIQFVITKVQTFLALGMGYFFLAFGGSKWTTSYVERYFAYAVASGVKLM